MVCIAPKALKIIRIEYIVKYNCPVGLKCSDTDSTNGFAVLWKGNNTVNHNIDLLYQFNLSDKNSLKIFNESTRDITNLNVLKCV